MTSEPLDGYVFVFTGNMSIERDEARGKALLLGARVTTSISSRTTHLVAGADPGPSKVQKARESGVRVIDEDEFMGIIGKYKSGTMENISTAVQPKDEKGAIHIHTAGVESSRTTQCNTLPWAEKYRPQTVGDLVGNKSAIDQLSSFVLGKSGFRAALVSGPPGVGKTTAALAVCRTNSMTPIEFNASDLRSKKSIAEHISGLVNNFVVSKDMKAGKKVIVMDEVDGMTSDRGGIPELISVIKQAKVPIICICNDKTHVKTRTLANHCLNLHFRKLDTRSILPRVKDILRKEGKCLNDGILNEIAANSNGDLRYALNTIQSIASRNVVSIESVDRGLVEKNALRGTFEIAAELFQKKSIADKIDAYFEDYSLMPLFVHENYLKCAFRSLRDFLVSAESISFSDVLDARIHGSEQEWSLMPYHAFFSVVYPLNNKALQRRMDFPSFLGQNSKMNKNSRLLGAITSHFRFKTTRREFRMFVAEVLYHRFVELLREGKLDDCIEIIRDSELLKDDVMNIGEILGSDDLKSVSTKFKAALTREYKKLDRRLPYAISNSTNEDKDSNEDIY